MHFSGRVHTVVYENSPQSFYILRIVLDNESGLPVVAKGTIPGMVVQVGMWIPFEGEWVTHPQHGRQISISKAPSIPKWDTATAASILTTHGVSERTSRTLRQSLEDDLVTVLDAGDIKRIDDAIGMLGAETPEFVIDRWRAAKAFIFTIGFLSDVGIPRSRISKVWDTFGAETQNVLSVDPWSLIMVDGITFAQADEVAKRLGLPMDSPNRIMGAVLNACRDQRGMGHLFLRTGEIFETVQTWCSNVTPQDVATSIRTLAQWKPKPRLVVDKNTRLGTVAVYEPWMHTIEIEAARHIVERRISAKDDSIVNKLRLCLGRPELPDNARTCAESAVSRWATASRLTLSAAQRQGVINAVIEPVSVITGLPGTGKTTSLKAVVDIARDMGLRVLLIAPTGIAAKRMASVTGVQAYTIHRAFAAKGWDDGQNERQSTYVGITGSSGSMADASDGSGERWGRSKDPYPADIVIVDESSMVDQHLLYRILTCTPDTARLVFIGDAAQLPSVGPGNVLAELIASGAFPVVALREIYRQADTSDIVVAAHAVNAGHIPKVDDRPSCDFRFLTLRDDRSVLSRVLSVAKQLHSEGVHFQVMSPRHAGVVGVTNLNAQLRELLNPKTPGTSEVRIGSEVLREGDRIMVVRNNYELGVFNGDIGSVVRIDMKSGYVDVDILGSSRIHFPLKDAADDLRLAYACTVHKMQGQESDVIVLPWVPGFNHQLQRNLLYTAITRAKRKAILIGSPEAMELAISNTKTDIRNTLFLDRVVALGGVKVGLIA